MARFIELDDGTVVPVSEEGEVLEQADETPPQPEIDENDLSDITQVDREDILGKPDGNSGEIDISDITSLDEEESMEDLFEYDGDEDEYPGVPASQGEPISKPPQRIKRMPRPYTPPPTTGLGGMRV